MALDAPRIVTRREIERRRPRFPSTARLESLWVVGDLASLERTTIAIVGSRAPSEAGRRLAFETAGALAAAGTCIISGLALGIDGAAHAGAVHAGAATVGVLGGGHHSFFPRRNEALAQEMIAAGGAVVSPFPPDQAAHPPQFLQRNGIVAALADAVVIVEAAARSGALNTASWAADLGIPVFAFPGDVDRPKVAGCLALLRDGATLVRSARDILDDLGIGCQPSLMRVATATSNARTAQRPSLETALLCCLQDGEATLDRLLECAPASPPAVIASLTALEIEGVIERRPGQRYSIVATGGKSGAVPSRDGGAVSSIVCGTHP
ncbi:MAG: DNA-protecting protein DprA [Candidatus Eremiobacteraeota bacterium]|nr:DNA-protecting protein DprA [Candidatus Eremiobacteraeota bacterium]